MAKKKDTREDSELNEKELALRNKRREIAKNMRTKKETLKVNPITKDLTGLSTEGEVALGDFLEKKVQFFHHNYRYTDFGYTDKKTQTHIMPPGGEEEAGADGKIRRYVKFSELYRKNVPDPSGRGHIAKCVCVFETQSKAMVDYFRNNPAFGISIFERAEDVLAINPEVADVMQQSVDKLVGLSNTDIIAKAKTYGIAVTHDIQVMRKRIIEKIAATEIEKSVQKQRAAAAPARKTEEVASKSY